MASQREETILNIRFLYSLTIFCSAFLLFLVQPLVAQMLLPLLGGSALVWNTAMVFFQALLLGGYVYAHQSLKKLGPRRQSKLHFLFMILAALFLPFLAIPSDPEGNTYPLLFLLTSLSVMVAAPFFILSSMSPLLQRWYLQSQSEDSNPYWLYMWSNAGSLSALIFYPFAFQTLFELNTQARVWSGLYLGLVILVFLCTRFIGPDSEKGEQETTPDQLARDLRPAHVRLMRPLSWISLAFIPSALLLAITTSITSNIPSTALLWILPLAAYLISFMVVFGRRRRVSTGVWGIFALVGLLLTVSVTVLGLTVNSMVMIALLVATQLFVSLAFHGRLVDSRPPDEDHEALTEFYVLLSLGGVLGGFFVAIIAPLIFSTLFELPLLVGLALIALSSFPKKAARIVALMGVLIWFVPAVVEPAHIYQARSPYGTHRVTKETSPAGDFHVLLHGNIRHGLQSTNPGLKHLPLAYFHYTSPIGEVFEDRRKLGLSGRIAVLGLGIGTLAVYRETEMTFYEIDPLVEEIARDPTLFTYLEDCGDSCSVVIGDGRVALAESTETYDVIVIDAYSGGSMPTHLGTREALEVYLSKLSEDGIILVNTSNMHVDFAQIIANTAAVLPGEPKTYDYQHWPREVALKDLRIGSSQWVLLGKTPEAAEPHVTNSLWAHTQPDGRQPWLDHRASLLPYLF